MKSLWKKFILPTLLPLLIGVAIGLILIPLFENKFIFKPSKYPKGNWQYNLISLGIRDCTFITSDGVKLNAWFLPVRNARSTVLICHGNGGNLSYFYSYLNQLAQLRVNTFVFDYRGYGKSEGEPTEAGVYLDVIATYQFLIRQPEVDSTKIIVQGISLGSAIAVELATRISCRALILESAPTSVEDVAKSRFLPIYLFIKSKFDSITKIKTLKLPILFIHGTDDHLVPISYGRKLFASASEPKWFYEVPNAGHNDLHEVGGKAYLQKLDEFISEVIE